MKKIFITFLLISSTLFILSKTPYKLTAKKSPILLTVGQSIPLKKFVDANPNNAIHQQNKLFFLIDAHKKPINNPAHFNQAVGSVPIIIPKKLFDSTVTVQNPKPWVTTFLQKIDGKQRLSFKNTPDLYTQFTTSLCNIMYFVNLNTNLNKPLKSRHARGPITLLFVTDPFPPHTAQGTQTTPGVDYLVAYCFEYAQPGDLDGLYLADGSTLKKIDTNYEMMPE